MPKMSFNLTNMYCSRCVLRKTFSVLTLFIQLQWRGGGPTKAFEADLGLFSKASFSNVICKGYKLLVKTSALLLLYQRQSLRH